MRTCRPRPSPSFIGTVWGAALSNEGFEPAQRSGSEGEASWLSADVPPTRPHRRQQEIGMDDYLRELRKDPEMARLLADQDRRLGDPVAAWRDRFKDRDQSEEARIRVVVAPMIESTLHEVVVPLLAKVEGDLRK